jgi:hypothetical protein
MQYQRLNENQTDPWPVPHFIADNVLSASELADAARHWPDTELIPEESPGSGYLVGSLMSDQFWPNLSADQQEYWRHFMNTVMPTVAAETLDIYNAWIEKKFGSRIETVEFVMFALTEFSSDKTGVGCHVHSHDPTWLFTNLIHIDDGGATTDIRGNALFAFPECETQDDYDEEVCKRLASVAPHAPLEGLSIVRNYDFNPGRMFSFFESPISYHGTLHPQPGAAVVAKRRMLRMHILAPNDLTEELYGIPYGDYRALKYPEDRVDDRMPKWIKRDIDDMFSATTERPADRPVTDDISLNLPELG